MWGVVDDYGEIPRNRLHKGAHNQRQIGRPLRICRSIPGNPGRILAGEAEETEEKEEEEE